MISWLTSDGNTAESKSRLDIENVFHMVFRRKHHGVVNKTILMTLYGANHRCLVLRWLVVVNDTDTTKKLDEKYKFVSHYTMKVN